MTTHLPAIFKLPLTMNLVDADSRANPEVTIRINIDILWVALCAS
jgi:hypothetical protein